MKVKGVAGNLEGRRAGWMVLSSFAAKGMPQGQGSDQQVQPWSFTIGRKPDALSPLLYQLWSAGADVEVDFTNKSNAKDEWIQFSLELRGVTLESYAGADGDGIEMTALSCKTVTAKGSDLDRFLNQIFIINSIVSGASRKPDVPRLDYSGGY